jgi:type I restriction enzyme, S subunit
MSEKRNVPKLRFAEFSNPWSDQKLQDSFSNSRKKGDSKTPIYSVSQSKGLVPRDSLDRVIQKDAKSEQNLRVEPEDIAYNMMRMWQGAYGISETTCMVSPAYVVLKPKKETVSRFFFYQFERKRSRYFFTTYSHGLTLDRLRLYFDDFGSIPVHVPSVPEQQKIAEFLTAVDRRIELLHAKKIKLEAYKKGVMQQIFSQKLRFKADDGSDFPDWEERKLGEIAKFSKGKGVSKSDISEEGTQECIRYGELYTDYAEVIDQVKSRTSLDPSTLALSQANDVIIPSSGESQIDIARAACVLRSGIALGGDLNIIRSILNGVFLSFYLNHRRKYEIAKMAQGISVVHLYNSQLEQLQIEIPAPEEQKKIVQYLTSLDSSIENLNQQITHTQTWKKGLLQKMFV